MYHDSKFGSKTFIATAAVNLRTAVDMGSMNNKLVRIGEAGQIRLNLSYTPSQVRLRHCTLSCHYVLIEIIASARWGFSSRLNCEDTELPVNQSPAWLSHDCIMEFPTAILRLHALRLQDVLTISSNTCKAMTRYWSFHVMKC